jgi:hypothetical protein
MSPYIELHNNKTLESSKYTEETEDKCTSYINTI